MYVSYLLKHSSDVDLSSLIPPPPTETGRSPPTISVSSKEHPAPDFLLAGGLPAGPVLVDGVQNPSPEPQYPNLTTLSKSQSVMQELPRAARLCLIAIFILLTNSLTRSEDLQSQQQDED